MEKKLSVKSSILEEKEEWNSNRKTDVRKECKKGCRKGSQNAVYVETKGKKALQRNVRK